MRRALRLALGAGLALALVVAAANAYVLLSARGEETSDVRALPHAQAAIVLGAYVQPSGAMSRGLADRVQRALQLWRSGKVDRIIVSGDHGRWGYDEPDTMRRALERHGVPAAAIFTDHAGFDTWASMVRARRVFGVRRAIVVTQGFHMPRALLLAHAAGLEAHGLTSDLHDLGRQGHRDSLREVLARVKGAEESVVHPSVLLGPAHPITGDGRSTLDAPARLAGYRT